nr:immunoglobulin light chain junction region [Macaca mulatta]MOX53823.1 immunoglobulin light chain junction region [Macaca mulatta]
CQQYNDLIFTF